MSQPEERVDAIEVLQLRLAATEEARCKAELRAAGLAIELLHSQIRAKYLLKKEDTIEVGTGAIVRAKPPQNGAA